MWGLDLFDENSKTIISLQFFLYSHFGFLNKFYTNVNVILMSSIHAKIFVLMSHLMLWQEIPLNLTLNLSNRIILQPYISNTFSLPTFSILCYLFSRYSHFGKGKWFIASCYFAKNCWFPNLKTNCIVLCRIIVQINNFLGFIRYTEHISLHFLLHIQ